MMTGRGTEHSLVLITLLSISLFSVFVSAADDNKNYSFGVVPQQSAERLAKLWGPVFAYVSKETGVKLQFKTAKNIPEFEKRLMAGDYDFAYM
ncbi:MAG: phosphonate transport system substrate-binding protein, partial [Cellvibrionaceae bacterium]